MIPRLFYLLLVVIKFRSFCGGNFAVDTAACIIKQQLAVVAEIGITSKILDKPAGIVARGYFGHKNDQFLSLTEGVFEEAEGVIKLLACGFAKLAAFLNFGAEPFLYCCHSFGRIGDVIAR